LATDAEDDDLGVKPDPLLLKCEELLETLYRHPGHAKLRRLVTDIEALRDRLLEERETDATYDSGGQPAREE
jgi:hypothetical protein